MDKLDPASFSQRERQNIIKTIIDMETLLHRYGISHNDTYSRNVLIDNNKHSTRKFYLIDFGHATVKKSHFSDGHKLNEEYPIGTQISPVLRLHEACDPAEMFKNWVDWDWQLWLEQTYIDTKDSVTDELTATFGPLTLWKHQPA